MTSASPALSRRRRLEHVVERLGDAAFEAVEVGAALGRGDDVDERLHVRGVVGAPAHRDVDAEGALDVLGRHVPLVVEQRHGLGEHVLALQPQHVGDRLVGSEELAELGDAAVVAELLLVRLVTAPVADDDLKAGHEERGLASSRDELLIGELGALDEDLRIGPVAHTRTGLGLGHLADLAQLVGGRELGVGTLTGEHTRDAATEGHRPGRAALVDLDIEPRRQRIDHRRADAVEAAGRDVGATAELPACVQLGVDDLDAGEAGLLLDVDRHAATVVLDLDGSVVVQGDPDVGAVARQCLVDGVVDDLPEAVHETASVGRADVHAGAFADGLQPLEDEEVARVIGAVDDGLPFELVELLQDYLRHLASRLWTRCSSARLRRFVPPGEYVCRRSRTATRNTAP